jgi:hypothetical protein
VNKLFPGKIQCIRVEEFVNSFKAGTENSAENWELVSGSDIGKYSCDNYKDMEDNLVVLAWLGREISFLFMRIIQMFVKC